MRGEGEGEGEDESLKISWLTLILTLTLMVISIQFTVTISFVKDISKDTVDINLCWFEAFCTETSRSIRFLYR